MSQVDTTNPAVEPVEAFTKLEQNGAALMPLRKAGLARFSESGYPTLRDEDWRFTNVKPIAELPFRPTLIRLAKRLAKSNLAMLHSANWVPIDWSLSMAISTLRCRKSATSQAA